MKVIGITHLMVHEMEHEPFQHQSERALLLAFSQGKSLECEIHKYETNLSDHTYERLFHLVPLLLSINIDANREGVQRETASGSGLCIAFVSLLSQS